MIIKVTKSLVTPIMAWVILGFYSCTQSPPKIEVSGTGQMIIPEIIDFNFHIKPILSDRCFACHGPDKGSRLSGLRLDTEEGAFAALGEEKDRHAIIPHYPDSSEMIKRIRHEDPKEIMPPPESNLKLSDYEKQLLTKWIEQGAKWKKHWAFIPPAKVELPTVQNTEWVQTPVDAFILNKLESTTMRPEAAAEKEQLLRRVSFDLTGLPPTLEDIDQFVNDDNENAFELAVDRLLSSSAFGERMASEWLDVARYADTHGYQDDLKRNMWPWRDWVIQSFNDNMPYDQFIKWQIAGDMFENATYEQVLATGFNRNHRVNQEGGIIDEEFRVEYVADRTNTTSTAFLGLTVSCARCHDHKYDPISTKEYYQMFAFFNNVPEKGRIEYDEPVKPLLKVPEDKIKEVKTYLNKLIAEENDKMEHRASEVKQEWNQIQEQWKSNSRKAKIALPSGIQMYTGLESEASNINRVSNSYAKRSDEQQPDFMPGLFGNALHMSSSSFVEIQNDFSPKASDPFTISLWIKTSPNNKDGIIVAKMEKANGDGGMKGFSLSMKNNKIGLNLVNSLPFNAISVTTKKTLRPSKWTHVAASYDGQQKGSGIKIYIDGKLETTTIEIDNLKGSIVNHETLKIGTAESQYTLNGCLIDELAIYGRAIDETEVIKAFSYDPIAEILSTTAQLRSEEDNQKLFYHYLYNQDDKYKYHLTNKFLSEQRKEFLNDPTANEVMVMEEMKKPRQAYILERGGYENHGEPVEPNTIQSVLSFSDDLPKNRLGLSEWLTDKNNPLTARVTINRYWQLLFGTGIVSTPNDFGSQGDLPSHPELLDWLAVDFMESGWDLKRAIKQMVMSATYQQASKVDPEKLELDPNNRLLARGVRFRLPAEMLRDHALAISGLLVNQIGGPSVKPYQPTGLWEEVTSGRGLAAYVEGIGDDLYRRSLYTYWKRTVPPPSMMIFDASEKNLCTVKRQSTSTPLQALVLLNDPQYIEVSRILAERVIIEGGEGFKNKIQLAFKLATSRLASEEELAILNEMYEQELEEFNTDSEKSEQLLSIGFQRPNATINSAELAAMTVVTNAILNLSETITRG